MRILLLLTLLTAPLVGCFHATIVTERATGGPAIDQSWATSLV